MAKFDHRHQDRWRHHTGCRQGTKTRAPMSRLVPATARFQVNCPGPTSPTITLCISRSNGARRLGRLWLALVAQTLPVDQWEILLLNLPGAGETSEAERQHLREHFGGRVRVVRVEQPGLAWLRARAAREASGEIICFLEDHHRPAPDFLTAVVQAFAERPAAGVIGGQVRLGWPGRPIPPVELVAPLALALRLGALGEATECLEAGDTGVPGAGLCVRRNVLLGIVSSPAPELAPADRERGWIHRVDLSLAVAARQMGWQCWYVPALKIEQMLETERLDQPGWLGLFEENRQHPPALRPLRWLRGLSDYCLWQFRHWRGPSPQLQHEHAGLAGGLHDLQQQLLRERARQAMTGMA